MEQRKENSRTSDGATMMVEQKNIRWWSSGTFDGGTVEQS